METSIQKQEQDFVFYEGNDGKVKVAVLVDNANDTIWMTQKAMAELFGAQIPAINKHIGNIFDSGELQQNSVLSKMEITATAKGKIKRHSSDRLCRRHCKSRLKIQNIAENLQRFFQYSVSIWYSVPLCLTHNQGVVGSSPTETTKHNTPQNKVLTIISKYLILRIDRCTLVQFGNYS